MLSLPDQLLSVKFFDMDSEPAIAEWQKFHKKKEFKMRKGLISCPVILKRLKGFEETTHVQDCTQRARPSMTKRRVIAVRSVVEDRAAQSSTRNSNNARGAGIILDFLMIDLAYSS